ncbi:DUF4129 domain-containing protein [Amycolatopsis ultiminotia]
MRHRDEATLPASVPMVGVLLAAGAAGLRARADSHWSFPGPFAHAGGTTMAVFASVLIVAGLLLVLFLFAALRRRRRPEDDDFQHVVEAPGTKWGRRWAVPAILAVTAAPLVGLAFMASRAARPGVAPIRLAPPAPPAPLPGPAGAPDGGGQSWLLLVVLLVVAALAVALVRRRRPRTANTGALAAATEAGRTELALPTAGGPRGAILRSFAAMERALAGSAEAAPRPSDTPSAVLARAADAGLVRSGPAGRLVDVFAEARFSHHPMTGAHQDTARRALDELLDDLGRRT